MAPVVHPYSQRITGAELPRNGKPILIRSYTVQKRGKEDYRIVLQGDNPFVEIDWPRNNGTITPEMLKVLVPKEAVRPLNADNTYVLIENSNNYEGLQRLRWDFRFRESERPFLDLGWEHRFRNSYRGALLGSVTERDDYLKVPGIDYFVRPEVVPRGKYLLEIRLYSQDNRMVHFLSPDVNRVAEFTIPEEPNKEWVRSEVERFKKNGANLKEKQVKDAYLQLRDHIWKSYSLIAGEILAWPMMLEEKP